MFVSTMFYPTAELPTWFRGAAWLNPMTWQVDLLRFSLLGIGAPAAVAAETAAFAVFTLACLAFAVRTIDRAA